MLGSNFDPLSMHEFINEVMKDHLVILQLKQLHKRSPIDIIETSSVGRTRHWYHKTILLNKKDRNCRNNDSSLENNKLLASQ